MRTPLSELHPNLGVDPTRIPAQKCVDVQPFSNFKLLFHTVEFGWQQVLFGWINQPKIQRPSIEQRRDQPARIHDRIVRHVGQAHGRPVPVREIDVTE